MKDNKRKYELSYFMKYGGSPAPNSSENNNNDEWRNQRLSNLNEEFKELEEKKRKEEEEAKKLEEEAKKLENEQNEEEEADFKRMLSESGFT